MIFGKFMANPHCSGFLFFFLALTCLIWAARACKLLSMMRKAPNVVPSSVPPSGVPVSVLIPAKNEEKNIRACWESFRAQTYKNLQIIVINDNSSDATESILKSTGADYVNCPLPPEGWTGKNHALFHGMQKARGEWLLFTDADTRHQPESVAAAVAYAEQNHLEFLSLMPYCLTETFLEEALQPSAMAYLGLWFPFERVNDPKDPLYFANGQYLLIKRGLYEKLGGHKAVAGAFLEDFALMNLAKKAGAGARCGFGTQIYGTRMYDSMKGIWRGWRRIYLHAFERDARPLLLNMARVFLFSVLPFAAAGAAFVSGEFYLAGLAAFTVGLILIISSQAYRTVRANPFFAVFHPVAALIVTFILADAAGMALTNKKTVWR